VKNTDHQTLHYVVVSTPLLPSPSFAQIFSNALILRSSLNVSDQMLPELKQNLGVQKFNDGSKMETIVT
jgi:hypothetical protein